jgi:hypothetical protein
MVRETFEITTMKKPFFNRVETGKSLAEKLTGYVDRDDVLLLALPCAGVRVALEVAKRLKDLARSWQDARPKTLNCFERDGAALSQERI